MIFALVTRELAIGWRLWAGAFVLAFFAGLIACVCAGDISTAHAMTPDQDPAGLINHAYIYMGFNAPVVVGALNILITYIVALQRPRYALWQLAGVAPRTIRTVVLLQTALLGLVAFALALLVAAPTLNFTLNTLSAPLRSDAEPIRVVTLAWPEVTVAFLVFMAVVLLSALGAATKARRTPILAAIRTPEVTNAPLSKARFVWAIVCLAIVVVCTISIMVTGSGWFAFGQMLIIIVFLPVASWVSERVMRLWVGLVPGGHESWYIARESAKYNVTRSHAGISLMVIAIGLGIFTGAFGLWSEPEYAAIAIVLFGSPLALALFAGAATIMMTSVHRRRESVLLTLSGATRSVLIVAAALEALIFTITAGIISLAIAVPFILTPTQQETATGETVIDNPLIPLVPIPFVLVIGFFVLFVTTVQPILQASRNSPASELRRAAV
ncbi:hypothetical protein HQQ80_03515 [Microbacteriaceae bacterium VKM Ac-2855]|nr:hypothetical protein [Microbacteriaceae bacterium VKM Ac-2855]